MLLGTFSILLSQNVGIGEPNPVSKLSVKGNLSVGNTYSATPPPTNGAIIEGNVGIGTSAPTQSLHVVGNMRLTGAFYDASNSAGTSGDVLISTAIGTSWQDPEAIGLKDHDWHEVGTSNPANSINDDIYTQGNVGIGTNSPTARLHVSNGDFRVDGTVAGGATCNSTNYTVSSTTYNWTTFTGTTVSLPDDGGSGPIPLPFSFIFFCNTYSSIYIASNGYVTFSNADLSDLSEDCIPNTTLPNDYIAGYWDDLNPSSGGTIKYGTVGTTPNRIFIVEFNGVPHYGSSTRTVTFQIKLFENDHSIEIHCQNCQDDGGTATQGIENAGGTAGFNLPGRECANFALTNDAVRFVPDLTIAPSGSPLFFADHANGKIGIGTATPSNVLTIMNASSTDPIADSWLVYSTPNSKIVLGTADDKTMHYLDKFRKLKVYQWKRTINEPVRLSVIATEDTPTEVLAYDENGNIQGIDLYGYIGFLHECMKGLQQIVDKQQQEIEQLKKELKHKKKRRPFLKRK